MVTVDFRYDSLGPYRSSHVNIHNSDGLLWCYQLFIRLLFTASHAIFTLHAKMPLSFLQILSHTSIPHNSNRKTLR